MPTIRPFVIAALFLVATASPGAGQTEFERKVFVNATFDLATAFSKNGLPAVNVLIPGDSPFDNFRLRVYADAILHPKLTVYTEFLVDPSLAANFEVFLRAYARFNAYTGKKADLSFQAGKIPTAFGTYAVRAYSEKNPLIGAPLMYHYFSSLRANQLPANNTDLLAKHGQGQPGVFAGFTGGGAAAKINGLPMVYDPGWDVGMAAVGSLWRFEYVMKVSRMWKSSINVPSGLMLNSASVI